MKILKTMLALAATMYMVNADMIHDPSLCILKRKRKALKSCCAKNKKAKCLKGGKYERGPKKCKDDKGKTQKRYYNVLCMREKTALTEDEKAEMEKTYIAGHQFSACTSTGSKAADKHDFDCCAIKGNGGCKEGFDFTEGPERCGLKTQDWTKGKIATECVKKPEPKAAEPADGGDDEKDKKDPNEKAAAQMNKDLDAAIGSVAAVAIGLYIGIIVAACCCCMILVCIIYALTKKSGGQTAPGGVVQMKQQDVVYAQPVAGQPVSQGTNLPGQQLQ